MGAPPPRIWLTACMACMLPVLLEAVVVVQLTPGRFFYAWIPCGSPWGCLHAVASPALPSYVGIEGTGPPHDQLLLYGTAPTNATDSATSFTVTAGSIVTAVTLAPSDPPSTTPPPTDVTAMAWDDLRLMVRSFNLTEMLQSEPPLPPRRLAALEQSVAAAVGSDAAVLVSAVHADGGSPRNKPPPLANGVPPPNWWIGRAVNVTFRVPRARVAAALTCDSVEARWQLVQSAPSVNFSQGGCFVAIDVPVSSGSGNGTGVININGSNTVSRLGGEDWSRSTYDFNATVGVACIVAAVVVVCAMVMAVLCSRKQPKDQVHEATSIQATRQIRRDVQVRTKWNMFPGERDMEAKDFLWRSKTRRRSTVSILRQEPYPTTEESTGLEADASAPPPPPQYRPPPDAGTLTPRSSSSFTFA